MRRRFIISIGEESESAVKRMVELLNHVGATQWWHYFNGLWLVIDEKGVLSPEKLRDEILRKFDDITQMVFEIPPGGICYGWGPKKAQKWLEEHWSTPGQ